MSVADRYQTKDQTRHQTKDQTRHQTKDQTRDQTKTVRSYTVEEKFNKRDEKKRGWKEVSADTWNTVNVREEDAVSVEPAEKVFLHCSVLFNGDGADDACVDMTYLDKSMIEWAVENRKRRVDIVRAVSDPDRHLAVILTLPPHMQPGVAVQYRELVRALTNDSEFDVNPLRRFEATYSKNDAKYWKALLSRKDEVTGNTPLHMLYALCLRKERDVIPVIQASMILLRHGADSKTIKNDSNETAFQYGCKFADLLKGRLKNASVESFGPEMVIAVLSLHDIGLPEPGIVDFLNLMKKFEAKTISRVDFDDQKRVVFENYGFSVKKKC